MILMISKLRPILPMVMIFVLVFYFFMAALQGETGLFRYLQLNAQIKAASAERDALITERERLANLTHRLSDDYLDLDLLDERARDRLGVVRSDEIIIR